jgi:hypothetical protein
MTEEFEHFNDAWNIDAGYLEFRGPSSRHAPLQHARTCSEGPRIA